ncbi:MAG: nucleotidyltransferase domain-containing protein [Candidatus Sumerlaeota bacterium]|nr:nucleotidyltransferase domain-containing protein [Candidatus Sumerlaeota bacterium]
MMNRRELMSRIKSALQAAHGERLKAVVLFGSEARNTATSESDIDILVVMRDKVCTQDDLANLDALYPLILESERPIDAISVAETDFEAALFPLYQNAKKEGIFL